MEETYIVSARKYRPATFESVVGQKALTMTLKNAIATGRLAHAYLFCGSRGVGKTSCARIFAKTINCEHRTETGEACNECESCRQFNQGRSMNIIELDAASNNGVEDMRDLTRQALIPPTTGRYRVFIVDEVHMLSSQAFNAFLKTLEEPPAHAVFILATTEKHKIIPTILSRCQIYDFNRITVADMVSHLQYVASQEGIQADPAALQVIAEKADGAMRDALSIFDQVAASSRNVITYESTIENLNVLDRRYYSRLIEAFAKADVPAALLIYREVRDKGFDALFFLNGLASYIRDLMVARDPSTICLLDAPDNVRAAMAADGARFAPEVFFKAMDILGEADLNFRLASNKQFHVELTLIRLCQLSSPSPLNNSGEGEGQLQKIAPATTGASALTSATPQTTSQPTQPTTPTPTPSRTTVSTPAPNPAAAPAAESTPARRTSLRAPGISLRHGVEKNGAPASTHTSTGTSTRRGEYTPAMMLEAWNSYIAANPTEHVLVNSMRSHLPETSGTPDAWVVSVDSEPQRNAFIDNIQTLLAHLRDHLANDNVTLEINVKAGEAAPAVWNEREVLHHILETSPRTRKLIEGFKLTLI